jgi:hypothetical protein
LLAKQLLTQLVPNFRVEIDQLTLQFPSVSDLSSLSGQQPASSLRVCTVCNDVLIQPKGLEDVETNIDFPSSLKSTEDGPISIVVGMKRLA